jgi:hypothetical protein
VRAHVGAQHGHAKFPVRGAIGIEIEMEAVKQLGQHLIDYADVATG